MICRLLDHRPVAMIATLPVRRRSFAHAEMPHTLRKPVCPLCPGAGNRLWRQWCAGESSCDASSVSALIAAKIRNRPIGRIPPHAEPCCE